jgi:hypothetical protein
MSLVPPGELTGQRGLRLADRNGQAEIGPSWAAASSSQDYQSLTAIANR